MDPRYVSFVVVLWFNAITTFLVGVFVLARNRKRVVTRIFGFYSISIAWWSFCEIWGIACDNRATALIWTRLEQVGVFFIPSFFVHFVISFLEITNKKWHLKIAYFFSFFFAVLSFTPYMIEDSISRSAMPYVKHFGVAGAAYHFAIFFFVILSIYGLKSLWDSLRHATPGLKKNQLQLLFWGCLGSYVGGAPNFLLVYNISIPILNPFGTCLVTLYVALVAYAIVRYRLMDIRLAISNTAVFISVYGFVLGIPFYIYALGFKLSSLIFAILFATAGPFIYLFVQKRAENALLQEQRRYQTTLSQASSGMGRIKDLKKLLNLIVYVVTRAVRLEHALVYVFDDHKKQFVLGASKRRTGHQGFINTFPLSSPLVQHLAKTHSTIIYEEIKQKAQDYKESGLIALERSIAELEGELVSPIQIEDRILAIIILGKKESGKLYTEDDLAVFSILSNQAALAIENAQFYEDMKTTQEQLFQAEKMATIGTMADGLSHQINNRFHALGFISGDALDTIKITRQKGNIPDHLKETFDDLERAFNRVQENVVQGGEVVQGLLRYTRKGDAGFGPVDFEACFKSAFEMAQFKIKANQLKIIHKYDPGQIPKVKGNFTQLQEVFFNLIDNGYDAMMQRKNDQQEEGFQPILNVYVRPLEGNEVEIIFEDNGAGVKEEDIVKLFTPFFTTKLSSKKGTGLGLYVIKKIIEENHKGKVEMVSKYMGGTQMKLRLPVAFE